MIISESNLESYDNRYVIVGTIENAFKEKLKLSLVWYSYL